MNESIRRIIRRVINEVLDENEIQVQNISPDEIDTILGSCDNALAIPHFDKVCSKDMGGARLRKVADWDTSIKLVKGGKIVGFYIFSNITPEEFLSNREHNFGLPFQVKDEELFKRLSGKKGVEGVALGVEHEARGKGYGRTLMEFPKSMGIDYIWGIQTSGLSDIDKWLKRRKILAHANIPGQEFWITVEEF